MKKSNKGIIMLALLLALIGSGALFIYLRSLDQPVVIQNDMRNVVVSKVDIAAFTQITSEMLQVVNVPGDAIIGEPLQNINDVVGKYALDNIYVNQQIHEKSISDSIEDKVGFKVTGSNRAVTVNVNELTGVNGLLKPGDFVDIIIFLPQATENNRVRADIAKLFLQNIEVLAIDKNYERSIDEKENVTTPEEDDGNYYVTLSVPVMDVEMLILAKDIGSIELALRPTEGDYIYVTEGAIWQELLLNDQNEMKDMAPEYDIIGTETTNSILDSYNYDKYIYYVVEFGDTLKSISQSFYGDESLYTLIQEVNRIDDVDMILTGTGIKIPVLINGGTNNGN